MFKEIILRFFWGFLWLLIGSLLSYLLVSFFLNDVANMFLKIGISSPSFLYAIDAVFFIILISFIIVLIIQRKIKYFSKYRNSTSIVLIIVIIHLLINFIASVNNINLPKWMTFPYSL